MNHDHDMNGGMGMASPPKAMAHGGGGMMMHMSFYWGHEATVLFDGWPGDNGAMYALSLVIVFLLALLAESLTYSRVMKSGPANFVRGILQTLVYAIKVGLCYMVMLAVMSFNVGVLLVAVAGHAAGFWLLGSRSLRGNDEKGSVMIASHC